MMEGAGIELGALARNHGLACRCPCLSANPPYKGRPEAVDHWHRTEDDEGRPYAFESAEKLIDDFFDEVEGVLKERKVPFIVTKTEERGKR